VLARSRRTITGLVGPAPSGVHPLAPGQDHEVIAAAFTQSDQLILRLKHLEREVLVHGQLRVDTALADHVAINLARAVGIGRDGHNQLDARTAGRAARP
jgi:hypothetical protein